MANAKNVFGGSLEVCCTSPMTGYYRNGRCETGPDDVGTHVVCARMTDDFLRFTRAQGNDLTTASPLNGFPGLKPGDRWCLCASRWQQALKAGVVPPVDLMATNEMVLQTVSLEELLAHAADPSPD